MQCGKCGKEMEKVVGFPGYVWCRDCHITKKVKKDGMSSENGHDKIEVES
ncbi:MAG: hypothetical protein ACQEQM_07065 [Thermoplasmatota archaeon]